MNNELKSKQAATQGYLIHAIYSMIKGMQDGKTITVKNRTAFLGSLVVVGLFVANSYIIKNSIMNELSTEIAASNKAALAYEKLQSDYNIQLEKLWKRSMGKQFYQATTLELAGGNKDEINYHINSMFSDNYERASMVKATWVADARRAGANFVADGVEMRINTFKNRDDFEALRKIVKYNLFKNKETD